MILGISVVSVVASLFFISNFINMSPLTFFLMSLAKSLLILFIFLKKNLFVSLIFSVILSLFYLFLLWSLWFLSLYLTLGFVCSFSSCFRCKLRWFTWDFTYLLRWDSIAINFRLWTAFAASQTLTWPNFCMYYFLSKSTAANARLVSVVGHSSIQISHRCRVYQTNLRDLVWGLSSYLEISFL